MGFVVTRSTGVCSFMSSGDPTSSGGVQYGLTAWVVLAPPSPPPPSAASLTAAESAAA